MKDKTLRVEPVTPRLAREVVEREHYMHRKPAVSFAHGLYRGADLVGVIVYGTPASRHLQMGACPSDPSLVIELNRLWVSDEMPANTESWFVSRSLKLLPPRIVASYADTSAGHMGYVYRACNFFYAGWTDMDRRTPRLDYVPLAEGAHSKGAGSRSGVKEKVRRRPKIRYWAVTGDKRERRSMAAMCAWPSYDWNRMPPPIEHRQYKGDAR